MKAISLVEYLVYLAIFVIFTAVIIGFIPRFFTITRQAAALRELQDNARIIREVLTQEITQAMSIYTPISVFGSNPGQLSLETKNALPLDETTTYVDFYVNTNPDGLFQKRESQNETRITSQNVQVTNFVVRHIQQASTPALRIEFSLDARDFPGNPIPFTFTVSLRPNT